MNFLKITTAALALTMTLAIGNTANAQIMAKKEKTVMVGGAPMYPTKNIVENAVNSKDHTTLVAAGKSRGIGGNFVKQRTIHGLRSDKCCLR